jgi:pimeloyl-ACP methyl ester carboxylesterase
MSVPTVYLHGFSGEGAGLEPFAKAYSGSNYVCIDMPGFGGTQAPSYGSKDIRVYSEHVWDEIRRHVPEGPVRLVGHSHGTMVGFVLAQTHADEVKRLDSFCPVVEPQLVPRLSVKSIILIRRLLSSNLVIRMLTWQTLVDMVTKYSLKREWSEESRQRIIEMRRREAKFYSPIIFDLMDQTQSFMELFADARSTVPTRICYTTDDNVSGEYDHAWYAERSKLEKIMAIDGGHLCVVAEPERVVRLFGKAD